MVNGNNDVLWLKILRIWFSSMQISNLQLYKPTSKQAYLLTADCREAGPVPHKADL